MLKEPEPEEKREAYEGMPRSPKALTTTADMGMGMFDLTNLNDLLTKGSLPAHLRPIFINGITVGITLTRKGMPKLGKVYLDLAYNYLRSFVGERGHTRTKDVITAFELELHHEKRKNEEKPQI